MSRWKQYNNANIEDREGILWNILNDDPSKGEVQRVHSLSTTPELAEAAMEKLSEFNKADPPEIAETI